MFMANNGVVQHISPQPWS